MFGLELVNKVNGTVQISTIKLLAVLYWVITMLPAKKKFFTIICSWRYVTTKQLSYTHLSVISIETWFSKRP